MNNTQNTIFKTIFTTKMLICIFTGFASGLPFYLLLQLLPAWLESEGINIKTIGAFSLTQMPYIFKFVWAPFMDNTSLFHLGRRRGWMLISQIILVLSISLLGFLSPSLNIWLIATLCFIIALFSATQDIALDAFRRELLLDNELGLGNSIHTNAYRVAGLVPGSLSLILSSYLAWHSVFIITALFMIPAIIMTLWVKEPLNQPVKKHNLEAIIIKPFSEFITRQGVKNAIIILAFIFLYKLGDSMATSLATPFYLQMGYSRLDIGWIAKNASLWPSVFGALVGGILMIKIGINRALWAFGFVQVISILGFAWLSIEGPFTTITGYQQIMLAIVIGFEALGVGLGSAAFVAFIAKTTNPLYTATQFALFTSIASIPRTLINATTGVMVEHLGWTTFFTLCTILALPGMLLLIKVAPWNTQH
ncbi:MULTISPECIES: AmpG family muropeptide MFS transporter [unclassified Gilliamella]|uniref:AmpG family muropeptide MFS transporter n=1 Tax=unclassified Gilliamella TaxID=2685620 RepID=UPI0022697F7C|nr:MULTISPECIES: AmpG family muropeptide MFS transporter [unclassified Gilliamella]MCX8641235.1 AmpG family muropeptide MFS transporter [Gilliamella sp. B3835]MCX8707006.1 AmpG family muropeptide MFS transporter [Gilliamella sp. B3783]MCX8709837.1 AmpG family muropeptide MFS transporter [Gilliamella sp. B3780]MCX8714182.1 AmpG family muropeptide MFS transporter [Gilliamella sp. B3781]MCX8715989.1 AmpG family muropeptide MFS transporter [Gilliamella sp. B3784]